MPAAVAVPAAVSLGSSVFSGLMGSSAAKKAAAGQAAAAQQQADAYRQMVDRYNPMIQSSAEQARGDVLGAAGQAGANLTDVADRAATGVTDAAGRANEYLQPYLDLGGQSAQTLAQMMQPGGDLNRSFTFQDMQALDPGYQFRIDQANKALAGSAAARGGALGGGAVKAALGLSQNLASSEYGAAFDRFRAQNTDRYNRFSNLVDLGSRTGALAGGNLMTAAQQAGNFRTGAAQTAGGWDINANEYGGNAMMNAANNQAANAFGAQRSIADLMTGAANAQAAGTVGSANAWGGALGGLANAAGQVGGYYQQKDLINQMQQGGYGGYNPNFQYYGQAPLYHPPAAQLPTYNGYPAQPYNNPSLQQWMYPTR